MPFRYEYEFEQDVQFSAVFKQVLHFFAAEQGAHLNYQLPETYLSCRAAKNTNKKVIKLNHKLDFHSCLLNCSFPHVNPFSACLCVK